MLRLEKRIIQSRITQEERQALLTVRKLFEEFEYEDNNNNDFFKQIHDDVVGFCEWEYFCEFITRLLIDSNIVEEE